MNKKFLTTFQAAKVMSVSPDAILKWIKSGILDARRTPGGHHRIARENIEALLNENEKNSATESVSSQKVFQYCWEFNTKNENCTGKCEDCVVYRARALRCFELSDFSEESGFLRRFCKSSCDECNYYLLMKAQN